MAKDAINEVKIRNIPFRLNQQEFVALVDRVTNGKYGSYVRLEQIPPQNGYDTYELQVSDGVIVIRATSGVAAGSALSAYLNRYCHFYYGFLTQSGDLPPVPPDTDEKISQTSAFVYRCAFNYCTFGYSYAFHTWEDWERVTDCLILGGYNLVLNPIANECIWVELLQRFGYTYEEAKSFLSAPNYLPWQWMMNLSGYSSHYSDQWFEEQRTISHSFIQKLSDFGAGVVLPGWAGLVPNDFALRFPKEKILKQGEWCGFTRPALLLPQPGGMFENIAETYYQLQKSILVPESTHYYSVDPFHEGGNKEGVDLASYASTVMQTMKKADPLAVWCLQGWNGNPDERILTAMKKQDVLIMNLHSDQSPNGGNGFLGYPYIYCVVNNFGGEQALRGSAWKTYYQPYSMAKDSKTSCCGIGMIPEGIECDEALFDIIANVTVKSDLASQREYVADYLKARYGISNEELIEAELLLFRRFYDKDTVTYTHESAFIAGPSATADRVCYWAGKAELRDNRDLLMIADTLLKYSEMCKDRESFRIDLVAVVRQLIANESWKYVYSMENAIAAGNLSEFEENSNRFLKLFDLQERTVDCDRNLSLKRYLNRAEKRGSTEEERRWLLASAKRLITSWGGPEEVTLHDYAAREYGDMLRLYYKPRWMKFVENARIGLRSGKQISFDYSQETEAFISNFDLPLQDNTPCDVIAEIREVVSIIRESL